jgi:hypothetical protein
VTPAQAVVPEGAAATKSEPAAVEPAKVVVVPVARASAAAAKPAAETPASNRAPRIEARAASRDGIAPNKYLIIASYANPRYARLAMADNRDLKPVLQAIRVHGKQYYRVIAGPFTLERAAQIVDRLHREYGLDPLIARNCADEGSGRCIHPAS